MAVDKSDFYDLYCSLDSGGEEVSFQTSGFHGHGRIYDLYKHDMLLIRTDSGKGNGYHMVTSSPEDFRVNRIDVFVNGNQYKYYCRTAAPKNYLAQVLDEYPADFVKQVLHKEDYELYLNKNAEVPPQVPLNDGARLASPLPNGSDERKQYPLDAVLFGQFPAAMAALAYHSYKGNEKHNPGQPLKWSRNKSADHKDCLLRHLMEGDYEAVLWRAAAILQLELEKEGAPIAPLATFD